MKKFIFTMFIALNTLQASASEKPYTLDSIAQQPTIFAHPECEVCSSCHEGSNNKDWNNFDFSAFHPASTETYRNAALYCTEVYNRIKPTSAKKTLQELVKPQQGAKIIDEHASTSPLIQDKLQN